MLSSLQINTHVSLRQLVLMISALRIIFCVTNHRNWKISNNLFTLTHKKGYLQT